MILPATGPSMDTRQCRNSHLATTKAFRSCWATQMAW